MEEFLKEYYTIFSNTVLITAALVAILTMKKFRNTNVKYFCWFLIYVFFLELLGSYTVLLDKSPSLINIKQSLEGTLIEKNFWVYNIFWAIGSALFYSSYFIKVLKNHSYIKVLKKGRSVFLILAVLYIVFNIKELFYNSILFIHIIGAMLILLSSVLYLIEILQSDKFLTFYKSINFYIASVIFLWFLVRTPMKFFDVYFSVKDWDYVILKSFLILVFNVFMYLTFSLALIFCKPEEAEVPN